MPISVDLGKPLEEFVTKLVDEGRYGSKSEVLREGARLVQEREAYLTNLLAEPLKSLERGEGLPASEVFDTLRTRATKLKHLPVDEA